MWNGEILTNAEVVEILDENGIAWYRAWDGDIMAQLDARYDDSDCVSGLTLRELYALVDNAVTKYADVFDAMMGNPLDALDALTI